MEDVWREEENREDQEEEKRLRISGTASITGGQKKNLDSDWTFASCLSCYIR